MAVKNFKLLLLVPIILVLFGIGVLVSGFLESGEWFERSIELRGGTLVTLTTDSQVDADTLKQYRRYEPDVRQLYQGIKIEGFLVGTVCENRADLEQEIGGDAISILIFDGTDRPRPDLITRCKHCDAGVFIYARNCECCNGNIAQGERWGT